MKKNPTFKNFGCRFNIVEKYVDEPLFEPIPPDRVEVYLVSAIGQDRKDKGDWAYDKVLDKSPPLKTKYLEHMT